MAQSTHYIHEIPFTTYKSLIYALSDSFHFISKKKRFLFLHQKHASFYNLIFNLLYAIGQMKDHLCFFMQYEFALVHSLIHSLVFNL